MLMLTPMSMVMGISTPMPVLTPMPMLLMLLEMWMPMQMPPPMWTVMGMRRPSPRGQRPPASHGLSCGARQSRCATRRSGCATPCCQERRVTLGAPSGCECCHQAQCMRPKRPERATQND